MLDGGGRGATTTFAQRNLGGALVTFESEAPLISDVRPHELVILSEAGDDTWAVTFSQTLTVGPNTRIEFKRVSDDSDVDFELPRERFTILRDQLGLAPGVQVHLRPRRVTRFGAAKASADSAPPIWRASDVRAPAGGCRMWPYLAVCGRIWPYVAVCGRSTSQPARQP